VCGAVCSQNDTGQKGEWISARFTALAVKGCGRTLSVYLFGRFALISYGWFIAICHKFKRSTYIQETLVIGGVLYREIQ
jgi:hypothetical protein